MLLRRLSEFAVCVAIVGLSFIAGADDKKTVSDTNGTTKAKDGRDVAWTERPIFLLTVKWPDIREKKEVKHTKLLGNRVYLKYEPRFFTIDKTTKERVYGAKVLDFTDEDGNFKDDPHRLLKVGSVLPGDILGDSPDVHYIFTAGKGEPEMRWVPTSKPIAYTYLELWKDGTGSEKLVLPTADVKNVIPPQ